MADITLDEAVNRAMVAFKCSRAEARARLEKAILSGELRFSAVDEELGRTITGKIIDGKFVEQQ